MIKFYLRIVKILIFVIFFNVSYAQNTQDNNIFYPLSTDFTPNIQFFPKHFLKQYDTISITFIGDVMQHGNQLRSALISGADPNKPESYSYKNSFKFIEKYLKESDISVANMEFTMGSTPYRGYPLFSAPHTIATQAKKSGINLFLIANNHLLDMGEKGLKKTLDIYDTIGVQYVGVYHNKQSELKNNPAIFDVKGLRIAILNFTYGTNGFKIPDPFVMNLMDSTHIKECIKRAKNKGADFIIAAPHWGEEYKLNPSDNQRQWAKMLLNQGVKIIIGGHPHVPQEAEITKDHIIFYSLGNYITNQSDPNYTQLELLVTIKIERNNITGATKLLPPSYKYLWCFKKGEFINDYTVVPIEDFIGKEHLVKNKFQYKRMLETYYKFLDKQLINYKDNK